MSHCLLKLLSVYSVILYFPIGSLAQENSRVGSFVQLDVENDAIQIHSRSVSDRYYTSGLRFSYLSNSWQRWPTRHLLLKLWPQNEQSSYKYLYDFTLGQEIYTPKNTLEAERPLYPNDRPYAGYLYASWGLVTTDDIKARRLTSAITVGAIGPVSGAAEVQDGFHMLTGQNYPAGWGTQMANDLALSYSVMYEGRAISQFSPAVDVIGRVEGFVGTLMNYVGMGGVMRIGLFNDYFQNPTGLYAPATTAVQRKFQCYATLGVTLRAVLDNALLQGGWFNQRNYYSLPAVETTHFYGQLDVGAVVAYRNCQLAFIQHLRSAEFVNALDDQWGHISLLFKVFK